MQDVKIKRLKYVHNNGNYKDNINNNHSKEHIGKQHAVIVRATAAHKKVGSAVKCSVIPFFHLT
jgi:hypothetical protein